MHPLDPLTGAEIEAASALIKAANPPNTVHFKNMALLEPAKKEMRRYLAAERTSSAALAALPKPIRRVSTLYYRRGTVDLFYATVNLDTSVVEGIARMDPIYHGQVDMIEATAVRDACLNDPQVKERIRQYGLPDDMVPVCDTWPYGRDSADPVRRLAQV